MKRYIPTEFNRKLKPINEVAYWKAAEFRFFLLYAGSIILKDKNILSDERYVHFLKFAVSMRALLHGNFLDVVVVQQLLSEFTSEAISLYGKQFMSYNVHALSHLVDDFLQHGPLENLSCFPFESFLGVIKNSIRSGYKPFEQAANKCNNENINICGGNSLPENKLKIAKLPGLLPPSLNTSNNTIIHCKKIVLSASNCVFKISSCNDSIIYFNESLFQVVNIIKVNLNMFFVVKKFKKIRDFFTYPVASSSVGIFLTKEKFYKDIELIPIEENIKKCVLLPYKNKLVACTFIHKV